MMQDQDQIDQPWESDFIVNYSVILANNNMHSQDG